MPEPARKRVGIVTIHNVPNYGAVLQAWALSRVIRELGHSVEIIDYRPPAADAFYLDRDAKSRFPWLRKFARWRFLRFQRRCMQLSPVCRSPEELAPLESRYDALVCGSDQIWNTKSFRGYDDAYFLAFSKSDSVRRIAYAPSCSGLDNFSPHDEAVAALLSRFDALSGRDEKTLELVRGLGFPGIQRVVDPTLLTGFDPLLRPARVKEPYLLLYGGIKPWALDPIRRCAKQRGMRVVNVEGLSRIADRSYAFALPDQWLGLFRDATAVVTSAFHGVMFAMKYNRPFLAIPASGKEAKVSDALNAYGLADRLVLEGVGAEEKINADNLYRGYDVASRLDPLVASSREYLKQALDG